MVNLEKDPNIRLLAKELRIKKKPNPEKSIREYCFRKVESILKNFIVNEGGSVNSLDKLLEIVAGKLGIKFEEINSDDDFEEIRNRYANRGELSFVGVMDELNNDTDAFLVQLRNVEPWEPKFIAAIDSRGLKATRANLFKWHEIAHFLWNESAHLLAPPAQMHLPFRKIHVNKKDPVEILMDKIARDLGSYHLLYSPEVKARTEKDKHLTFNIVNELRREVCSNTSPLVTLKAAVEGVSFPCLFLKAGFVLKKDEKTLLNSKQDSLFPETNDRIDKKFRTIQVKSNNYARQSGMLIFKNMEVPESSIIYQVYDNLERGKVFSNVEDLNWWKSTRRRLGDYPVYIEAKKAKDYVWALISPLK
jgi:hypothetical protein